MSDEEPDAVPFVIGLLAVALFPFLGDHLAAVGELFSIGFVAMWSALTFGFDPFLTALFSPVLGVVILTTMKYIGVSTDAEPVIRDDPDVDVEYNYESEIVPEDAELRAPDGHEVRAPGGDVVRKATHTPDSYEITELTEVRTMPEDDRDHVHVEPDTDVRRLELGAGDDRRARFLVDVDGEPVPVVPTDVPGYDPVDAARDEYLDHGDEQRFEERLEADLATLHDLGDLVDDDPATIDATILADQDVEKSTE